MTNTQQNCDICFKIENNLIKTSETDINNIKWSVKLNNCVPEVDWNDDGLMCKSCTDKLDAVCAFKELCIQSRTIRKQDLIKLETKVFCDYSPESNSENETKTHHLCSTCNIIFDCHKNLLTHNKNVHQEVKYTCDICNINYTTQSVLIRHKKLKHSDDKLNCIYNSNVSDEYFCFHCDKSYTNKETLAEHITNEHNNHNQSEECKNYKTYSSFKKQVNNGVKKQLKNKTKDDVNKCEICGVVFSSKYLIKRHIRNVHASEKKYKCDTCGQKFASPVYLSAHKRYHSGDRPHICSFCGKAYITASDLYHHEKIHANKRAYRCDKCPKAFNTSSDLHKHKTCVHVDRSQWKYVCSFCQRRFPLKTNLDTHTKTHTGEKNFACHMCDRRCINQSVLKRHIESHSNVRSFKCSMCSQQYKYQKSLDIHMVKAHGIGDAKVPERVKKYFCHICPKSYFANNKLQKHIRTHTGERPFGCNMCEKRFIDKSYVKQHLKTAHNVTFPNQLFDK